jgi:cardiolipin synthase
VTDAAHRPAPGLLAGGSADYGCVWRLLRQARAEVELETYIYEAGVVGDRFLTELTVAARRGVRARVLVDEYGSDALPEGYFAPLLAAGGQLRWFNPKRLLRINFRNHRKSLRVDGEAVVGDLNIADVYDGDGVTSAWRDHRWWHSLRSYFAYQLLARLDPYLAACSLRSLR